MGDIIRFREEFKNALLELNRLEVTNILKKAQEYKDNAGFVEDILVPVLEEIGDAWESGTVALSQVYVSGRICEELVEIMYPLQTDCESKIPTTAIVTYDDYHPLGKKIVYSTLKASGLSVIDYGLGVEEEWLVEKIIEDGIRILIISVLMLPAALRVKDLVDKLHARRINIKILVGGAPFRFDTELWREIGADAMARTPLETMAVVRKWEAENDER